MTARFFLPALLAGCVIAQGSHAQGAWYISGSAGGLFAPGFTRSTTLVNTGTGVSGPGTLSGTYDTGEAFNIAVGHAMPFGLRLEGEVGYNHYTADTITAFSYGARLPELNGTKVSSINGGDYDRVTATVNVFKDLPISLAGLVPYFGGGVGFYHASATDGLFGPLPDGRNFRTFGGSGNNALLLGEAGVSYAVAPGLSVVPAYRYQYFFRENGGNQGFHVVKLGLRYSF